MFLAVNCSSKSTSANRRQYIQYDSNNNNIDINNNNNLNNNNNNNNNNKNNINNNNNNNNINSNFENTVLLDISCGVLQGSVLGQILFILYINDLCFVSQFLEPIMFADDTNLFCSNKKTIRFF